MQNHIVAMNGHHIIRRDRYDRIHRGVCIYIGNSIIFFFVIRGFVRYIFSSCMDLNSQPSRLPRSFIYSILVTGTVYHHPPPHPPVLIIALC